MVELLKAWRQVQSGGRKIEALEKAVSSGKLLMMATAQSIKGGVRINLDLLDAQQHLYTSQRDLAQARYEYLLAQLRLHAAAGTLDGGTSGSCKLPLNRTLLNRISGDAGGGVLTPEVRPSDHTGFKGTVEELTSLLYCEKMFYEDTKI
jgi:hypothetical protein